MFVQLTPYPSWVWAYDRLHLVPGKDLPVEGLERVVSDESLRRPEGDGHVAIPRPAKRDFVFYTYIRVLWPTVQRSGAKLHTKTCYGWTMESGFTYLIHNLMSRGFFQLGLSSAPPGR